MNEFGLGLELCWLPKSTLILSRKYALELLDLFGPRDGRGCSTPVMFIFLHTVEKAWTREGGEVGKVRR